MGKLEEARPLYEEALQARKETLAGRPRPGHADLDQQHGRAAEEDGQAARGARPLYEEALQAQRETLGHRHPDTLISIYNLADLLEKQGKIAEAIPLFTEELEGCVLLHGIWRTRGDARFSRAPGQAATQRRPAR